MKACVITIGNEILKGKTVNTNAAEIGRMLYFSGYEVYRGLTVQDNEAEIRWALKSVLGLCDIIVLSGGLGPTFDDITVLSFAREVGVPLVRDEETYIRIKEKAEKRGLQMTEEREKMALIPDGARTITNIVGSAPGIEFNAKGTRVFILPGVPEEMRSMLESIRNKIKLRDSFYEEESITIKGVFEASLAPFVKKLMNSHGDAVYIKTHPGTSKEGEPVLEVEVSSKSDDQAKAKEIVRSILNEIALEAQNIKDLESPKEGHK